MCVISEFLEQYTLSQMTQRYSSCLSACLSAMWRLREAFEHRTLPHSWHVNTFLGDAPATTAKPSSLWSRSARVLPPADTRGGDHLPLSLSLSFSLILCVLFSPSSNHAICPRELSITASLCRATLRPKPPTSYKYWPMRCPSHPVMSPQLVSIVKLVTTFWNLLGTLKLILTNSFHAFEVTQVS